MKKRRIVLSFPPSKVEEPIIYHLITDYNLMVNILRATIDPHKQGQMVVELSGEDAQLSQGFNYLESAGVQVDPLTQEVKHLEERCTSCTACVPLCPTGALDVNRENWVVSYDAQKCVVCLSCVDACPYNAREIYLQ
jgi:Fe-S-cluster-containing dehydrogenase component